MPLVRAVPRRRSGIGAASARHGYNLPPRPALPGRPKRPRRAPDGGPRSASPAPPPRLDPELSSCPRNCCPTTPRPSWHSPTARCSRAASIGAAGETTGEVVFNTALTGYQEILDRPELLPADRHADVSAHRQLRRQRRGRRGGDRCFAAGLVVKDVPVRASNFRSAASLPRLPARARARSAIAGIDTPPADARPAQRRRAERLHRRAGAARALTPRARSTTRDRQGARGAEHGRARPGQGRERARALRVDARPTWALGRGYGTLRPRRAATSSPTTSASSSTSCACSPSAAAGSRWCRRRRRRPRCWRCKPDGVFLANGPGDPEPCDYAIAATRELIDARRADLRHLPRPPDHGARLRARRPSR